MTTYELPAVGVPEWCGSEREVVSFGSCVINMHGLDSYIDDVAGRLARAVAARDFAAAESEKSKWDCAGERAFVAHRKIQIRSPFALSWDELTVAQRDYWVAVAKAVLDGEH